MKKSVFFSISAVCAITALCCIFTPAPKPEALAFHAEPQSLIMGHRHIEEQPNTNEVQTLDEQQPMRKHRKEDKKGIVTVMGKGEIEVQPDIAIISVGIENNGSELSETISANSTALSGLIDALDDIVPIEDIHTERYNVYSEYDYTDGKALSGYTVTNVICIQVNDLNNMNDVLDTALQNGANSIGNIRFEISDQDEYYKQALSLAVADAEEKASLLSDSTLTMVKIDEKGHPHNKGNRMNNNHMNNASNHQVEARVYVTFADIDNTDIEAEMTL